MKVVTLLLSNAYHFMTGKHALSEINRNFACNTKNLKNLKPKKLKT